jgi:hypothetical protein
MRKDILIKTPQCEMTLETLCYREFCKTNNLMNIIEKTFGVSMHDYPELRHEILDLSNFIKRLPDMVSEV